MGHFVAREIARSYSQREYLECQVCRAELPRIVPQLGGIPEQMLRRITNSERKGVDGETKGIFRKAPADTNKLHASIFCGQEPVRNKMRIWPKYRNF